ncbi:RdRp [Neuropteran phasma-related virus OKIAV248]|uniref:RNA-directed RNA polymerase L n=1 Tax=Neuropteran phasma-related virus OKIAV248 TaxID=2789453 RepID=A0A7U3NUM3_9VIRU|nr:RdRp [Neuropteran phasma-related virus OKIAV248]QPB73987.1 RdRp [Neuropteran phasma-related virus OKIAV248]
MITQEELSDPDKAVEKCQWFLEERSKEAERYVGSYMRLIDPLSSYHDKSINEFLTERGLNTIPAGTQDINKTPDVLAMVGTVIIMGDVAVSRSPEDVAVRKRIKYRMIMDSIKLFNGNYMVRFESFIFRDDGSNIEMVQNQLKELIQEFNPVLRWELGDRERRLKEQLIEWNNRLNYVSRNVKDKRSFIYRYRMVEAEWEDDILLGSMRQTEEYKPHVSEEDIAKSIFDKVFKSSKIKKTKNINLNEVKAMIDDKREVGFAKAEPKHCIPYLFNSGDNTEMMDLDLLEDYKNDLSSCASPLATLMPTGNVMANMKQLKLEINEKRITGVNKANNEFRKNMKEKYGRTTPYYANHNELINRAENEDNIKDWYFEKVTSLNDKEEPKSIKLESHQRCIKSVEGLVKVMNMKSKSTSANIEFDLPDRGDRLEREIKLVNELKPVYDVMNNKISTCLLSCVRKFVNDLSYMPGNLKKGIYYSIPLQKNMIILIFTNTNLNKKNPSIYFSTITRFLKNDEQDMMLYNLQVKFSRYREETDRYYYIVDKLHKYELEKLSKLSNVDREFRVHYMSMSSMSDLDQEQYKLYMDCYTGLTALCLLDLHQKPSDMLDLMKYLVAMPMSTHSSLDELLVDKLSMMLKTDLDVFLYNNLFRFLKRNIELNNTRKTNELIIQKNGYIMPESFNITGKFAMFCNPSIITENLLFYVSESQLIFHTRPKKLYNSQFIDKCAIKIIDYNEGMRKDEKENPGWTTKGYNSEDNKLFDYPYESNFCYSRDAMYYAQLDEDAELARFSMGVIRSSNKKTAELFPHNLSMRGACVIPGSNLDNSKEIYRKLKNKRLVSEELVKMNKSKRTKPPEEIFRIRRSTTAMMSGLTMMDDCIRRDDTEMARIGNIMTKHKDDEMYFNMSEKEQRGPGRPIGSADFFTKQRLYCIEMMYQKIGERQGDNLMARKVNRSAKLSDVSRNMIDHAIKNNKRYLSYIVMDQSQFSESDNINKFLANIEDNRCIPVNIKSDMIDSLSKMKTRTQYFPKIPTTIKDNHPEYITNTKGLRGEAGWVQGMLNISSTHIHIIAVKWITKLFNTYYKKFVTEDFDEVKVEHLVNSDDSFAVICSKRPEVIAHYYEFLLWAKRLFCLKQNKKKSYMSSIIGEVIQKYVANGSTINIWAKDAVSVFNSMRGLDMYKDVSTAIGSLQTLSRNGASELICCYVRAECKNKILQTFNVNKDKINDISTYGIDIGKLPVELLGWPKYITTYELSVAGAFAQSNYCIGCYDRSKNNEGKWTSKESLVVIAAILLNMANSISKSNNEINVFENSEQQQSIIIKEIQRIKNLLEADDLDEEEVQEVDRLQLEENYRERDLISFRAIGLESSSGGFTKSLLNPFHFCHPFSTKVTDTVRKLKTYDGEPSGLAGLVKIRTSVKTAVVDIRENISALLMSLSEQGFNNDFRMIAATSSIVASSRSVLLPGSKNKHTIRQCFKILLDISYKMESRAIYKKAQDVAPLIMRDPTFRATMTDEILINMRETGIIESRPVVVTLMPEIENDLGLANPLQLVLSEIVKEGTIVKEGYILNYPDQLSADIAVIKSKFGDWLDVSKNKLPIACGIYYHYLNYRRGRYVVGPPMDRGDLMSFLISWYKVKYSDRYTITGNYSGKEVNREVNFKDNSPNVVCSIAEVYFKCCILGNLIDKEQFLEDMKLSIRGTTYSVRQFCESDISDVMMNELDTQYRPLLGAMLFDITKDDKHLRRYMKSETTKAEWIKEQMKKFNPYSKRVTWTGEFIVDIIKGNDAVRIDGEPGNINMIYTNNKNMRVIMESLLFLRRNNRFDNYEVKRDAKTLFNDKFFSTKDIVKISGYEETIDATGKYPYFRTNPIKEGKDVSYFTERGLVPITVVDDKFFNLRKEDSEEYTSFSIELGRVPQLVGKTKIYMYEVSKTDGSTKYVEKDNNNRLTRLDVSFPRFTTNGMSASHLTITGIPMSELINDEELKNVVRTNITNISKTNLKKYINYQIPYGNLYEALINNLNTIYNDTAEIKVETFNQLKVVNIDVELDRLEFAQDMEEIAGEEIDELDVRVMPDREGNVLSKMLETYTSKSADTSDLAGFMTLLKNDRMVELISESKTLLEQDDWNGGYDQILTLSSILTFKLMDDIEMMKSNYERDQDNLEIETMLNVADDSYLYNRDLDEVDKLYELNMDVLDLLLINRLYDLDNLRHLLNKADGEKLNRRNKYLPWYRQFSTYYRQSVAESN